MPEALSASEAQLGREYDLIIGGQRIRTADKFARPIPRGPRRSSASTPKPAQSTPSRRRGRPGGLRDLVPVPVAASASDLLLRAAALIRERNFDFCAWLTLEVGKNWAEADADVGECIDFLEFYAREALRLGRRHHPHPVPRRAQPAPLHSARCRRRHSPLELPLRHHGRHDRRRHRLRQHRRPQALTRRPHHRRALRRLLEEAGLPDGVVNLLPRRARASAAPSSSIRRSASSPSPAPRRSASKSTSAPPEPSPASASSSAPSSRWAARTPSSSTPTADLDAAVEGVAASAFGFNGQKCSACSRVIVDAAIYDVFCDRLARARRARSSPATPRRTSTPAPSSTPPPTSASSTTSRSARSEGRLLTGGAAVEQRDGGYYIAPTVFADVAPTARIAQEEIFGPVLAVIKSDDFDEALAIANNTEYGLTGAIYTSSREKLDRARDEFHVGNLYLNRKCTGAMVGAHPFGGFNMSGTDSKAGGPDYLTLFTQAKSIAEKLGVVSRRGRRAGTAHGAVETRPTALSSGELFVR